MKLLLVFLVVSVGVNLASSMTIQERDADASVRLQSDQAIVKQLMDTINSTRIETVVRHLSTYYSRGHMHNESQIWLLDEVRAAVADYPGQATISEVEHCRDCSEYKQEYMKSIIVKLEGSDPSLKEEVVILGAHQDSVNFIGYTFRAPGADDNASGTALLLECLRIIAEAGLRFDRTLEFHWYARKERTTYLGPHGSVEIAEQYTTAGVNVIAMLNIDSVGSHVEGFDVIGIVNDHADAYLVALLHALTDTYLEFRRFDKKCNSDAAASDFCTDHKSWNAVGVPAVTITERFESPRSDRYDDEPEFVNFPQVLQFAKLTVAFFTEMAGISE